MSQVEKILPRRRSAATVAQILRSPEIEAFIRTIERSHSRGRRGYGPRRLVPLILVKQLYVQETWTATLDLVADHPTLTRLCGCDSRDELPSADAVYRFLAKLRANARWIEILLERVQASLRDLDPEYGKVIAGDSTDIPAHANGQKYVRQGGPLRERYADPDASWGHRGAVSNRTGGGYYGYKAHGAVCVKRELPVGWVTLTAKASEAASVEEWLTDSLARGFRPTTMLLDKGYDSAPVYESCHSRRIRLVCPLRAPDRLRDGNRVSICTHDGVEHSWTYAGTDMKRGATKWRCPLGRCDPKSMWLPLDRFHPAVPRTTPRSREIYASRTAVERFWSRLKEEWGLLELRVRRLDRVGQHVDLIILGYLLFNLARLRGSP